MDGELPEYAILSHTWGSEEITFHDFENFSKILGACKAAQQNNLDYLWVDTCCIDKSSSSELSESINSMFAWYEGAALFYFYNKKWVLLGNKMLFARLLYDITGIETTFRTKESSIPASRKATREEDRAYSLLGIFGVNMPLIYGERSNSFIRL
ncbi:heterokaryon incompatibility protein-domain-containing protein [Xylaria digitata]|nr:heterokaryon incompatibility protein-domain-containing protein [Xylaria digitata]